MINNINSIDYKNNNDKVTTIKDIYQKNRNETVYNNNKIIKTCLSYPESILFKKKHGEFKMHSIIYDCNPHVKPYVYTIF